MAFVGDSLSAPRVQRALAYIGRWWNHASSDPGWKNGTNPNEQAAYTCMKGLQAFGIDLIDTNGDGTPETDWFDDMSTIEVTRQIPVGMDKGYWASDPYGQDTIMATAWVLLVLQKEAPPVAKYDLAIHVKDALTTLPIVGATVDVVGPESRSGLTNGTGWAEFLDLLVGDYTITASATGYQPNSVSIKLDQDKTVQIELTPLLLGATIESSDSTGTKKDTFYPADDVYVIGSGYSPSTTYDLYLVEDVATWSDGMPIPTRVAGTANAISSDASGNIPTTLVWSALLTLGKYDIVVDVNGNGVYDAGVDALDDSDIQVTAGFNVIPEVPFGTLMTFVSMFIALIGFIGFKNFRPKFRP